jgi:prepilin-type N-terminal cleavage/methylation domain-containing protein
MKRLGFTLMEILMVLVVVGLIVAMTLPKIHSALQKTNVRSARIAFGSFAALTRAAAVQRGCVATLNFTTGSAGKVWVTACRVSGSGAVDTIGSVEPLATRYGVSMSSSGASLRYDPRGLSIGYQTLAVTFTPTAGGQADSVMINQLGKVVR